MAIVMRDGKVVLPSVNFEDGNVRFDDNAAHALR